MVLRNCDASDVENDASFIVESALKGSFATKRKKEISIDVSSLFDSLVEDMWAWLFVLSSVKSVALVSTDLGVHFFLCSLSPRRIYFPVDIPRLYSFQYAQLFSTRSLTHLKTISLNGSES
jgi:hypothetical protein